jgi:hypothetical protein
MFSSTVYKYKEPEMGDKIAVILPSQMLQARRSLTFFLASIFIYFLHLQHNYSVPSAPMRRLNKTPSKRNATGSKWTRL